MLSKIIRFLKVKVEQKRIFKSKKVKIESRHASIKAKYGQEVFIGQGTIIADDVEIGDYSYVNRNSSVENAVIGKYCSISSGVYINPFEHDNTLFTTHPIANEFSFQKNKKVTIGNDVLISLNVIILSGVTIGDGAVIGAGAIVTSDVMPYEIVGGVPAKHLKWRFTSDVIEELSKSQWWDNDKKYVLREMNNLNTKVNREGGI